MLNKYLLLFIVSLFFITTVSADLGSFDPGECVELRTILNSTSVNFSSISYPNGTVLYLDEAMTTNGNTFNYSFCDTDLLGDYVYDYFDVTNEEPYVNSFVIGKDLTTSEAIINSILIFIILFLFILSLYFAFAISYSNEVDMKGAVIRITRKKYIKMVAISMAYLSFVWLLNVLVSLSTNYFGFSTQYGYFSFIFLTLNYLAWPISIFILALAFFEIVRDANIQKQIARFGKVIS